MKDYPVIDLTEVDADGSLSIPPPGNHFQSQQPLNCDDDSRSSRNQQSSHTDNVNELLDVDIDSLNKSTHQNTNSNNQGAMKTHISKIRFKDGDPITDFTKEDIPFVIFKNIDSYTDDINNVNHPIHLTKVHNILDSPDTMNTAFSNVLPFQVISDNSESHFAKYIINFTANKILGQSRLDKLIDNNDKNQHYNVRNEVIEMLKDTPVDNKTEETGPQGKRKNVRKGDPTKLEPCRTQRFLMVEKESLTKYYSNTCYICGTLIDRQIDKFMVVCKQTQDTVTIKHLNNNMMNLSEQGLIKTVCLQCLEGNFRAIVILKSSECRSLEAPDYLIFNDNKHYVFRKITNINLKDANCDHDMTYKDDRIKRPRDVIEITDDDEYRSTGNANEKTANGENEFKCRFCHHVFGSVRELGSHASDHRHSTEEGYVIPCPLCEYGYPNLIWLKSHLKNEHENKPESADDAENNKSAQKEIIDIQDSPTCETIQNNAVIAQESQTLGGCPSLPLQLFTQVEVKRETSDDDEAIWIVQAADDVADDDRHNDNNTDPKNEDIACTRETSKQAKKTVKTSAGESQWEIRNLMSRDVSGVTRQMKFEMDQQKTRRPPMDTELMICHDCNEHFTSKVRLRFHLQFHEQQDNPHLTESGRFVCPDCPNMPTFDTDSQLFDHLHFQHPRLRFWKCLYKGCGKTFHLKATLTKHSRTHTNSRRYICGTCGKRFLDKQTLDEHGVTHLEVKPYECHICLKQLTRRSRLRMHLRAHLEEPTPRLVLVCAVCSQAFRDYREAQDHILTSPLCSQCLQRRQVTTHLSPTTGLLTRTEPEPAFPPELKSWKAQSHSAEAQRMLSQLSADARDIIRVVEIEKALRCEYCELVYYSEEGLNSHREVHQGVANPYICHICKVSFSTYSRCTTHKTTHGYFKHPLSCDAATQVMGYGDFPVVKHFLCEICGRSYLHWTYLQVHRRNKHRRKIEHVCSSCNLAFSHGWALSNHRKTSTCTDIDFYGKLISCDPLDQPAETNSQYSMCVKYNIRNKPKQVKKENTGKDSQFHKGGNFDKDIFRSNDDKFDNDSKSDIEIFVNNNDRIESEEHGSQYDNADKNNANKTDGQSAFQCHNKNCSCVVHDNRTKENVSTDKNYNSVECGRRGDAKKVVKVTKNRTKKEAKQRDTYRIKCRDCETVLSSKTELYLHRNKEHRQWSLFEKSEDDSASETRTHTKPKPSQPPNTNSMVVSDVDDVSLEVDLRIHDKKKGLTCNLCGTTFKRLTDLRSHALHHATFENLTTRRIQRPWTVIQILGTAPSPEEVTNSLQRHGIALKEVSDVSRISVKKGSTSIIPDSITALNELISCPVVSVVSLAHLLPNTCSTTSSP